MDFFKQLAFPDPQTSKNNNESDKMEIKPVKSDQCHCCAEDAKTAHTSGNYECKTCEFFFRKMSSLKRHNIVMHWEKHPCTCEDCGIVFDDKKSYDKHRYTTHKANNVFKWVKLMKLIFVKLSQNTDV